MRGLFGRGVPDPETWQPRLWAVLAGLLVLLLYVVAFVVKNDKEVGVDFVVGTASASVIWVILLSLVIGMLAGVLLSQLYRRRGRQQRG